MNEPYGAEECNLEPLEHEPDKAEVIQKKQTDIHNMFKPHRAEAV